VVFVQENESVTGDERWRWRWRCAGLWEYASLSVKGEFDGILDTREVGTIGRQTVSDELGDR